VAVTPEAAEDLRRRHPGARVEEIPNGFEPELLEMRRPTSGTTILHSGTLTKDRPLAPLLRALKPPLRLVLHGYVAPEILAEVEASDAEVELVPPSGWQDAVRRIAEADVALVTQSRGAGDTTAVAAKVYEYLALGKPVLSITDGGATEALLRRLGADGLVARLDDGESIGAALDKIRAGNLPPAVPPEKLAQYERPRLAAQLADVLASAADSSG
jgi:glycosyltransferase involved in cell wall biosynthesis